MAGRKWAVLVGVDVYEPVAESHKGKCDTRGIPIEYLTLHGAVSDILQVKQHLIDHMGVDKCRIRTLITRPWDDRPIIGSTELSPSDGTPTYSNIIEALAWVLDNAEKDDLVYFHYSGHGAQATTVFPNLKGEDGLDEALVPTDANNGGKYVRDVEMALWLKKMVKMGLIVTVVLDSCHSGSATRGAGRVRFRGVQPTYKSAAEDYPGPEFKADLVAHDIGTAADVAHKGSILKDHWFVEPQGYTLLAACFPRETAREYEDDNENSHGALTYWLLDTLRKNPLAAASMRNLYRRVCTKIQTLFSDQNPVIGGTTDRAFFGTDILPAVYDVLVQSVRWGRLAESHELDLSGGTLHGVRKGSTYGIFSSDNQMCTMLGRVQVKDVFPLKSVATLTEMSEAGKIEPGCRAVLLSVPAEQQFRVGISPRVDRVVVERFREAWEEAPSKTVWMQLVPENDTRQLTFRIDVNDSGNFEIQDGDGVALPNLVPPLPELSPERLRSPEKLVSRLGHLTLFNKVKMLENLDGRSTMRGAILFEVAGKSGDGTNNTSAANMVQVQERNGALDARHNDKLVLRVKNQLQDEIFFAIFDLQPCFRVLQIYPKGADSEQLDGGSERLLPLRMTVPPNCTGPWCVDTFKIIATMRPTCLGMLQLPDICDAEVGGSRSGGNNQLQFMLNAYRSRRRNGTVPLPEEWVTEEVTIRTFR